MLLLQWCAESRMDIIGSTGSSSALLERQSSTSCFSLCPVVCFCSFFFFLAECCFLQWFACLHPAPQLLGLLRLRGRTLYAAKMGYSEIIVFFFLHVGAIPPVCDNLCNTHRADPECFWSFLLLFVIVEPSPPVYVCHVLRYDIDNVKGNVFYYL